MWLESPPRMAAAEWGLGGRGAECLECDARPPGGAALTTWTISALRSFSRRRFRFSARRCFFSWNRGEGVVGPGAGAALVSEAPGESWPTPQGGKGLLAGSRSFLVVCGWPARKDKPCPQGTKGPPGWGGPDPT